jgi:hypothetical protein
VSTARVLSATCEKCGARLKVRTRRDDKVVACPRCAHGVAVSVAPRPGAGHDRGRPPVARPEAEPAARRRELATLLGVVAGLVALTAALIAAIALVETVAWVVGALFTLVTVGCGLSVIRMLSRMTFGLVDDWSEAWSEIGGAVVVGALSLGLAAFVYWVGGVGGAPVENEPAAGRPHGGLDLRPAAGFRAPV